jgi:hypothetical protein
MCAEPKDAKLKMIVQVILDQIGAPDPDIGISFNGSWPTFHRAQTNSFVYPTGSLTDLPPGHRAFNFPADPGQIRDGWNEIVVYNNAKFYALITKGELASEADRQRLGIRVLGVEIGIMED